MNLQLNNIFTKILLLKNFQLNLLILLIKNYLLLIDFKIYNFFYFQFTINFLNNWDNYINYNFIKNKYFINLNYGNNTSIIFEKNLLNWNGTDINIDLNKNYFKKFNLLVY